MLDLLDAKTLGEKLKVSPNTAKALMVSWGVPCVHLGVGRGKGFRWSARDVEAALEKRKIERLEPETSPQPINKKEKKTLHAAAMAFFALPAGEALALTKKQPRQ